MPTSDYRPLAINHAAFTVSHDALERGDRDRIIEFFSGCLDFAHDTDSKNIRLVHKPAGQSMSAFGSTYLVFIGKTEAAKANPGRGGDHIGITCSSLEQFDSFLGRIKDYLAKYRLEGNLEGYPAEFASPALHGFFVRPFDSPIAVEVQFFETGPISSS